MNNNRNTIVDWQPGTFGGPRRLLWHLIAAMILIVSVGSAAWALPLLPIQVSTNPGNGDQNPYGVIYVPAGFPTTTVQPGNILVANFNDGMNNQGQGTTIINIRQDRTSALFAKVATPGLTAAIGILRAGYVLIGSITVPKVNNFPMASSGAITILDANGKTVMTLPGFSKTNPKSLIDGPWGMAVDDEGATALVFVSNVLNGTIIRINLTLTPTLVVNSVTRIIQGLGFINTMTTPLIGPSGLAYSQETHNLYLSSAISSSIFALPNANTLTGPSSAGFLVYHDTVHLHGPLGLVLAPNGDLISAQNDGINTNPAMPSEIVEFTPVPHTVGIFVAQYSIDPNLGSAFDIALNQSPDPLVPLGFAYVDDFSGTLVQTYLPTWQIGYGNILLKHH
jgi:hypothetical protein